MATGRFWRLLGVAAAAAALWGTYLWAWFVGFAEDPVWYLDPARNFALGKGLAMNLLVPAQIAGLAPGTRPPVRLLLHGPLAPLLIGLGYKLFGVADWVPLAQSFALTLAAGLMIYRLASELGGERAGLLGAALYWSSYMVMESDYSALADPLFIALITAGLLCLWESSKGRAAAAWCAGAGLCLGVASCARLAGQAYWLGFLGAAIWLHRRRWRPPLALAGALAAAQLPLALYHHAVAGIYFYSPGYYVLIWSPSFPGFRSSTSFMNLTSLQAVLAYPRDFLQKMVTGPAYASGRFLETAADPYLMACAALGLFSDYGAGSARQRFRDVAWILFLPVFAFNAVMTYGGARYLAPVLPALAVAASLFLCRFLDENRRPPWRRFWLAAPLFALFFLAPAAVRIKDDWKSRPQRRQAYEDQVRLGSFVRERTGPEEVVYTDNNRLIAWQAERPAVSLTATLADAEKTFERLPPDALVLTSQRIDSSDYDQAWRDAFYQRKPVLGFLPCADYRGPSLSAILFRRPGRCRGG